MSVLVTLGVGLAGGCGAVARLLVNEAVTARAGARFPWGILAVNLSGALALGLLTGTGSDHVIAATGFVGAYTTFSTWVVDSRALGLRLGAANLLGSLALGLAAVWLGRALL